MVLKYRFLGKGYTDENGVAHMTEDADGQAVSGYTGTGRGLTDVVASTDDKDTVKESSLLSETYEVLDCLYYGDETLELSPSSNANVELSTEWSSVGEKSAKLTPNNASSTYCASKSFTALSEDTTLKLKLDCRTNCKVVAFILINNPWSISSVTLTPKNVGVFENFLDAETEAFTIPQGKSWGIRFDVQTSSVSNDNISYLDNIRLYKA